jgi:predicted transposase YdaD
MNRQKGRKAGRQEGRKAGRQEGRKKNRLNFFIYKDFVTL